jgi:hypothetical protein
MDGVSVVMAYVVIALLTMGLSVLVWRFATKRTEDIGQGGFKNTR